MDTYHECRNCGADAYVYFVAKGYEECRECGHRRIVSNAWFAAAACRGLDPELFHPDRGMTIQLEEALAVCATCEVREPCLRYALANSERFGVWGGKSAKQRAEMRRARGLMPTVSRKCRGCQDEFQTTNRKQRWCSRRCYTHHVHNPNATRGIPRRKRS